MGEEKRGWEKEEGEREKRDVDEGVRRDKKGQVCKNGFLLIQHSMQW